MRANTMAIVTALCAACGGSGGGTGDDTGDDGSDDEPPPIPGSYEDPLVRRATIPRQGQGVFHPAEMLVDGNILYYCGTPGGLARVNITNPDAPVPLGAVMPNNRRKCQHLAKSATRMFATSRGDEMDPIPFVAAFDVTGATPTPIGVYLGGGESFEGVSTSGGLAYVAQHTDGIAVLSPGGGALTRIGQLTTGFDNAWDVAITGTTLVVADASFGVRTVDISVPSAPAHRGALAITNGSPQAVVVAGDLAYVALGAGGLAVVDVGVPTAPTLVGSLDTPGSAIELALSGTTLYLADWDDVRVIDVANPAAPVLLAAEAVFTGPQRQYTRFLGAAGTADRGFYGEFGGQVYTFELFADRIAPEIRPATMEVAFRRTDPGGATAYALIVENEGRAPLAVTAIDVASGVFVGDTQYFGLDPGEATVVEIQFNPTSAALATGTVTFTTDDPDEPALVVDLVGNKPTLQVGDPAPPVELALLGGGTWRLSDQVGDPVLLSYFATF